MKTEKEKKNGDEDVGTILHGVYTDCLEREYELLYNVLKLT